MLWVHADNIARAIVTHLDHSDASVRREGLDQLQMLLAKLAAQSATSAGLPPEWLLPYVPMLLRRAREPDEKEKRAGEADKSVRWSATQTLRLLPWMPPQQLISCLRREPPEMQEWAAGTLLRQVQDDERGAGMLEADEMCALVPHLSHKVRRVGS